MSQICPDIISFPESPATHPERWVLMNVFTRQCLGVGPEVMTVLANPDVESTATYRIWRIWRFSHIDGLLADPSRFKRDAGTWGDPQIVDHATLIKLLKDQCIFIDDLASYRARFDVKKSLLDRQRFGTYHQQLGQQLIAIERRDPTAWWLEQKFTPDLAAIRQDNLYGAVQDRFLDQWLPRRITPGMRILDLGCGAGTIAQKMARLGASVLGVDPNPEYIRRASERAEGDSTFQVLDLNSPGALDALPAASFDCIYMSDALLFYFVPYEPGKPLDLLRFISDIKRLLKPGGTFLSLEPHPVFYIQPWLGDPARPFTVMTEYLHTHWRINPPLATLTRPFLDAGFTVIGIEELASDPENPKVDARAARFAAEFPVWLLVEFQAPANA
ncbi:MAG: class I SAM-dependent methyltransferase [Prosthecobacter sp.]|uniref:class I SAM-dependent methyltransferase n=1 Tax=Prosthecobacter sp. TaxID=1965333 RepID=UPI003903943A